MLGLSVLHSKQETRKVKDASVQGVTASVSSDAGRAADSRRNPDRRALGGIFHISAPVLVLLLFMLCSLVATARWLEADDVEELFLASEGGDVETLRRVLDAGVDLSVTDEDGITALNIAVAGQAIRVNKIESVQLLLAAGADPNAHEPATTEHPGWTPLHHAASRLVEDSDVARILLEHGADVNARTTGGETPLLLWARSHGHFCSETAQLLFQHGADAAASDASGRTALFYWARNQLRLRKYPDEFRDIFPAPGQLKQVLLEHGASPDIVIATMVGDINSVRESLVTAPGLASRQGQGGCTPLYAAAWAREMDIAKLLLLHNADVDGRNWDGATPLHGAALSESIEVAEMLLARGAQVNARDDSGRTPLHVAVWSGEDSTLPLQARAGHPLRAIHDSAPFIKLLVRHGADVNATNSQGQTPLHLAARNRPTEVLALLLKMGAYPNGHDEEGLTPLHLLVSSPWETVERIPEGLPSAEHDAFWANVSDLRRAEGVKLLTAAGADPSIPSAMGVVPLDWVNPKHERTAAALIAAGGDRQPELPAMVPPALREHVALSFDQTPLGIVLEFLAHVSEMQIMSDDSDIQGRITLQFEGPLSDALDAVCKQAGLIWTVVGDTVWIRGYGRYRRGGMAP